MVGQSTQQGTEPDAGAIGSSGAAAVEGPLIVEGPLMIGKRVVDPSLITGVKYLGRLYSLMERLAPAGCERDAAGNRRLLFSQYAGLVLLGLSGARSGGCICSSRCIANSPNR